jgi:xanthine dehydrogenase molybdopterin-binding subunit B
MLSAIELIESYLSSQLADNPVVIHLERAAAADLEVGAQTRWYVRMSSEEKTVVTVWLTVRERTLHYETYLAPAPEENIAQAFEYALRVNKRLVDMALCIGGEDAFYLQGQVELDQVDEPALDRILGGLYAASEETFPTIMRIGYASHFGRSLG